MNPWIVVKIGRSDSPLKRQHVGAYETTAGECMMIQTRVQVIDRDISSSPYISLASFV
jgi:hypothetical protein